MRQRRVCCYQRNPSEGETNFCYCLQEHSYIVAKEPPVNPSCKSFASGRQEKRGVSSSRPMAFCLLPLAAVLKGIYCKRSMDSNPALSIGSERARETLLGCPLISPRPVSRVRSDCGELREMSITLINDSGKSLIWWRGRTFVYCFPQDYLFTRVWHRPRTAAVGSRLPEGELAGKRRDNYFIIFVFLVFQVRYLAKKRKSNRFVSFGGWVPLMPKRSRRVSLSRK